MTLVDIWLCHLISSLVFTSLLWYLDNVRPGKYGVAQPWYFPFSVSHSSDLPTKHKLISSQRSYWCGDSAELAARDKTELRDNLLFEEEPNKQKGVEVLNLRKVFRGKRDIVAVAGVTFNAFQGEITALLGHNGAGKTTTMSMLTGLFSPSSGEARINGFNIKTDMQAARDSLGLCPQHNMLFPSLTVMEHLIFFGMVGTTLYFPACITLRVYLTLVICFLLKSKLISLYLLYY